MNKEEALILIRKVVEAKAREGEWSMNGIDMFEALKILIPELQNIKTPIPLSATFWQQ